MKPQDMVMVLEKLGFQGLKLVKTEGKTAAFTYTDWTERTTKGTLGAPTITSNKKVMVFNIPNVGRLGVAPASSMLRLIADKEDEGLADTSHLAKTDVPQPYLVALEKAKVHPELRVKWLAKMWDWFNEHKFGGRMQPPKFEVALKRGKDAKTRGIYFHGPFFRPGRMFLASFLFNARNAFILEILLHEMCVTGDALIATDLGMIRMDQIKEKGARYVMTRRGKARIQKWWKSGIKPTFTVTTESGIELRLTGNHPVLTLHKSGRLKWVRTDELTSSHYVVRTLRNVTIEDSEDLSHAMESQLGLGYLKAETKKFPQVMTPKLARLLGYLTAEGSFLDGSNPNTVGFYNTDNDLVEDYVQCWHACFGFRPSISVGEHGLHSVVVTRKDIAAWLESIGFVRGKAPTKRVPHCIMQSTSKNIKHFLRAFVEGDGSVRSGGTLDINSSSHNLVSDLALLFGSLGLVTTHGTFVAQHNFNKGVMYSRIRVLDGERVAKIIGAVSEKRRAILTGALYYHASKSQSIPGKQWRIPFVGALLEKAGVSCRPQKDGGMWPEKLFDALEEAPAVLRKRLAELKGEFVFEKILSVQATGQVEDVYDMTTEAHQFVANGLVVHNCHQAVDTLDRVPYDKATKGHGTHWQEWMRKVGLDPRRFDPTDDVEYQSTGEILNSEAGLTRAYGPRKTETFWKKQKLITSPRTGDVLLRYKGRALDAYSRNPSGRKYEFSFRKPNGDISSLLYQSWPAHDVFEKEIK